MKTGTGLMAGEQKPLHHRALKWYDESHRNTSGAEQQSGQRP